ncbi:MAG: Ser-Thr-rich GPI-anchored membrane family protein, partial [Candidatus Hodarchaeales archaeon]
YFNFSDKPVNWKSAEIAFDLYSVDSTVNLSVYLIEDAWEELTITWNNKPSKGVLIETLIISAEKIYKVNVSDYISGRNNISVCLWTPDVVSYNQVQGDTKEGFFNPPQLIWTYGETAEFTITNPTSSTHWYDLNFYTIQWTSIGMIDDVGLELYKGTTFVEDITWLLGYTSNDGEYEFYVSSAENYNGNNYRIKITDYDDPNVYDYSDYFSINIGTGTLTVTNPSSSSSWKPGSTQIITWSSTGNIIDVDIDIYKGNVLKYYVSDVSNLGLYSWTIDENIELGTDWRIKISNSGDSSENDWSDYFAISSAQADPIPGYDVIIIISTLCLLSIPYIRKRLKKRI